MMQLGEKQVSDFMTENVIFVEASTRLSDAIRLMDEHRLSAVPVVGENETVVGILAISDLLNVFHEIQSDLVALNVVNDDTREFLLKLLMDAGDHTCVRDVMTSPVVTIEKQTNLVLAARILHERGYHHLPVVDDKGHAVGILASSDFVRAIADYGALMAG